jgi:hypothetical protein
MRIVSCGSSFSSLDSRLPGTHISERFASEYNAELISLAKPGATNFAIRLQIESAIKLKPDLILFEFASASRIDLPLAVLGKPVQYNQHNLASNVRYTNYYNIIPNEINIEQESIVSDGIKNFIDGQCFPLNEKLTPDARKALQYWFTELYNEELKYHQDYFVCTSAFQSLEHSGIPYVWTRGDLCMFDWSIYKNEVPEGGNMWLGWTDPGIESVYHTTPESQAILFEFWLATYRKIYE